MKQTIIDIDDLFRIKQGFIRHEDYEKYTYEEINAIMYGVGMDSIMEHGWNLDEFERTIDERIDRFLIEENEKVRAAILQRSEG